MTTRIITPATSHLLIDPADIAVALDLQNDLPAAERLAEVASFAVTVMCGRTSFGRATYLTTHRLSPSRTNRNVLPLALDHDINVNVTEIVADGVELAPSLYDLDNAVVYRLDETGARVRWIESVIAIRYVAGYQLPEDAPALLRHAALDAATQIHASRGRDLSIRAEQQDGVGRVDYAANPGALLSTEMHSLIKRYASGPDVG